METKKIESLLVTAEQKEALQALARAHSKDNKPIMVTLVREAQWREHYMGVITLDDTPKDGIPDYVICSHISGSDLCDQVSAAIKKHWSK